jgi:hypothetical protein
MLFEWAGKTSCRCGAPGSATDAPSAPDSALPGLSESCEPRAKRGAPNPGKSAPREGGRVGSRRPWIVRPSASFVHVLTLSAKRKGRAERPGHGRRREGSETNLANHWFPRLFQPMGSQSFYYGVNRSGPPRSPLKLQRKQTGRGWTSPCFCAPEPGDSYLPQPPLASRHSASTKSSSPRGGALPPHVPPAHPPLWALP